MPESFVQVNVPATAGKKLKTFESVDGLGNLVESEAVTITDGAGNEVAPATEATAAAILARQADGSQHTVVDNASIAVTGPLTDAELRAAPVHTIIDAMPPITIGTVDQGAPGAFPWLVDGSSVVQPVSGPLTDVQLRAAAVPVSAAALPLPVGASTEVTLAAIKAKTDNLDVLLSTRTKPADSQHVTVDNASIAVTGPLTDAQLRAAPVPVSGTVATGGLTDAQLRAAPVAVDGSGVTQPISAAALPLPAGAASEVTLAAVLARQADGSQHTIVDNASIAVTGPLTDAELRAAPVPVSGPLTDVELRAAPVPVSAAALPLPAGAATEATLAAVLARQADGTQHTIVDNASIAVTGPLTDVQLRAAAVPVSAAALPLPAGAATEVTLAAIKAKTDNLDVLLSTRTKPADSQHVTVDNASIAVTGPLTDAQLRATPVPISGTVATGGLTDAQLRAAAVPVSAAALPLPAGAATEVTLAAVFARQADGTQHTIIDSMPPITIGTVDQGAPGAFPWLVDGSGSVQPVSGPLTDVQLRAAAVPVSAAALPLPAGASTEVTLAAIKAKTDNLDVLLSTRTKPADSQHVTVDNASIAVTGPLTDTQLRATPVPVSGTVATGGLTDAQLRAAAVPVSAAALPLPAGAATEVTLAAVLARQADGTQHTIVDNASIAVTGPLTDAQLRAAAIHTIIDAMPAITIGTVDQGAPGALPWLVDGSGVVQPVSGPLTDAQLRAAPVPVSAAALPLPAGASTEVTLAAIKAKTDNLDVLLSTRTKPADSQHVTVDNASIAITAAALPLPAGAATSALQTQPGVDIGDVTVNNAAGAAAVNIQDGGNSITVDQVATTTPGVLGIAGSTATAQVTGLGFGLYLQSTGNFNGQLDITCSVDGGNTYVPAYVRAIQSQAMPPGVLLANQLATGTITGNGTIMLSASLDVLLPAGVTHVKVTATALTGGAPITIKFAQSTIARDALVDQVIGSPIPPVAVQVGASDGTNIQVPRVFDADTGAGTQYVAGAVLRKSANGGSVEAGTAADPLRVDPTGTTAQPVTDNAGSLTVDTPQLPVALVGARLDTNAGAWLGSTAPTVGQKTMANSLPVAIASDQSALTVTAADTSVSTTFVGVASLSIALAGHASAAVLFNGHGSWNGIIQFEMSSDGGTTWTPTQAYLTPTTTSSNPQYFLVAALQRNPGAIEKWIFQFLAGATHCRVRVSSFTSGTCDATLVATAIPVTDAHYDIMSGLTGPSGSSIGAAHVYDLDGSAGTDEYVLGVNFRRTGLLPGGPSQEMVGQSTMAKSLPVAIASDQSSLAVVGAAASDAPVAGNPLLVAGRASAAAPADVSNDGDAVSAWLLRNGAQAAVITAAGALIGGDAANGLDVDITRVPADPFGLNADAASATGSISAKLRNISAVQLPAALVGGRLDENVGAWLGSTAPTVGQKTSANSLPTTLASDQVYAEDSAHVSGDTLMMAGVVQQAADAALSNDGDRSLLQVDATGFAKMNLKAWLGSTAPTVGQKTSANSLPVAIASDQSNLQVVGAAAAGAAVAGNPVLAGVYDGTNVQRLRGDANGRIEVVQPIPAWSGVYAVSVRQSAATAAGAIVWGLLNTDATKIVSIMAIQLQMFFDGTAAATLMKYEIVKYTGCTAMTSGAAVTALEKRTSLTPVSTCKVLDTGIAQTGGTAQAVVPIGVMGRVTQTTTNFAASQRDVLGAQFRSPFSMAIELAQNELLAIRQSALSVIGDNVVGFVEVAEAA